MSIQKTLYINTTNDESDFKLSVSLAAFNDDINYVYNENDENNTYICTENIRIGSPRLTFSGYESYVLEDTPYIDGQYYTHDLKPINYEDTFGIADDFIKISLPDSSDLSWASDIGITATSDAITDGRISYQEIDGKTLIFNVNTPFEGNDDFTIQNLRQFKSPTLFFLTKF